MNSPTPRFCFVFFNKHTHKLLFGKRWLVGCSAIVKEQEAGLKESPEWESFWSHNWMSIKILLWEFVDDTVTKKYGKPLTLEKVVLKQVLSRVIDQGAQSPTKGTGPTDPTKGMTAGSKKSCNSDKQVQIKWKGNSDTLSQCWVQTKINPNSVSDKEWAKCKNKAVLQTRWLHSVW